MIKRFLFVGLAALVLARPETYKENEEFNYSRSSTDEGKKSGFYKAQRGNVDGNYERAHNMDHVAQGQMSDIVNQVGAQVKEVADSNQGNVFGSAYARGVYGQRHYDTSNLAGRNFGENSYGSHTSSSDSSAASSAASTASHYQQYGGGSHGALSDNLNAGSSLYQTNEYGSGYQAGQASRHQASSGYQHSSGSSHHSSSNAELYDQNHIHSDMTSQHRIIPVYITVRPLTPVRIPVKATANQEIIDSSYSQRNEDESRTNSQNSLTRNTANSGVYSTGTVGTVVPSNKHYESSYSYRNEWEKQSDVTPAPLAIPATNPLSDTLVDSTYDQRQEYNRQNQYRREQSSHSQNNAASNAEIISGTQAIRNQQAALNERGYQTGYQYQRVAEPINNRYVVLSSTPEFVVTGTKTGGAYRGSHSQQSGYASGSRSENHSAYEDQALTQGHMRTNNDNLLAASSHNHDALMAIAGSNGISGDIGNSGVAGHSGSNGDSGSSYGTGPKKYESAYSYHKSWERQGDPYIIQPASTGSVNGQAESLKTSTNYGYGGRNARYSTAHAHTSQDDCDEHQRYTRSTYGYRGKQVQPSQGISQQIQEDLGQQTEDLNQQTEDFGQYTQDLTQQTEDLGQQTEDLTQQTVDFGQQSQDLNQQTEDLGQQNQHFHQHTEQQTSNSDNRVRYYPTGWQAVESAGQPVPQHGYLHSPSHLEEFGNKAEPVQVQQTEEQAAINNEYMGQQVQQGWDDSGHLEQHVQSGWDQSNMGQESEGIWTSNPTYVSAIQNGARGLAQDKDNLQGHNSIAHSETGRRSEQQGNNRWGTFDQNSQDAFAHSGHQNAWEEGTYQHHLHHSYHSTQQMQSNWNQQEYGLNEETEINNRNEPGYGNPEILIPVGRNNINNRESEQDSYRHYGHSNYGSHNIHTYPKSTLETTTTIKTTTEKNYDKPTVNNNKNKIDEDEEISAGTILRGDLGSENSIGATTSTTSKSLTVEEYDEYLRGLLSSVTNDKDDKKIQIESPPNPVFISKAKTPEEIEALSLMRDSDHTSNKYSTRQTSIYIDQGKNMEHIDQNVDSVQQTEYIGEEVEDDNKKTEAEDQRADSVGYAGQETNGFGSIFNQRQSESDGQQLESFGKSKPNVDQQREVSVSTYNQPGESIGNQQVNNYHRGFEVVGPSNHERPTEMGQHLEKTSKKDEEQKQFEEVQKNTQDMITFLRGLSNGSTKLQTNNKTSESSQKPTYYAPKPIPYGHNNVQGQQTANQQSENIGQEESLDQMPDEIGQETVNLDQQIADFGQQSENFNWQQGRQQTSNLDQQTQDFGQQVESLNKNFETKPQRYSESSTQIENFGQQVQSFGQHTDNEPQKHSDLSQESEDLSQQVQNFDQHSDNASQNNSDLGQPSEDLGQQVQSFDQHADNIPQKYSDMGQQSEDLGHLVQSVDQHAETEEQKYPDLGQQSEDLGQQVQSFDQHADNEPQKYSDLGQQSEDLGQLVQSFDQHAETEPQKYLDFGQQVQSFDEKDNNFKTIDSVPTQTREIPQENVANYRHYDNLDQKSKEPAVNSEEAKVVGINVKKDGPLSNGPTDSTSPNPESENPGFWKRVGNKFGTAKDKVSCWFGKC